MAAKATVNQRERYGVEAVLGTGVPASKALRTVGLSIEPEIETGKVEPSGRRFGTGTFVTSESSKGSLEGNLCGRELVDIFNLIYGHGVGTVIEEGVYKRIYTIKEQGTSWTVQIGQSDVTQVTGLVATDCEFSFHKKEATIKAGLVGQLYTTDGIPASSTEEVDNELFTGAGVGVFVADSLAELDSAPTRLPRAIKQTVKLDSIRKSSWYTNETQASWGDVSADKMNGSSVELTLEADAQGRGFLAELRSGAVKYLRIRVVGQPITEDENFVLTLDFAIAVEGYNEGDEDAVYAATVPLAVVEDVNGFAHRAFLTSDVDLTEIEGADVPDEPTNLEITPLDEGLEVSFIAPTSDGGSEITGYEYTIDGGTTWTLITGDIHTTFIIDELTNGVEYTVQVRAINLVGPSAPSSPETGTPVAEEEA